MSRLRQDPLTGRWVIIAEGRSARPNEFSRQLRERLPTRTCPFCPGHEGDTPPEVLAVGRAAGQQANGPGWRLRVFANLYPALEPIENESAVAPAQGTGLFRHGMGTGRHEVVVYTPQHGGSPAALSVAGWTDLLCVLRDRAREFVRCPAVRYVSAFCNHGPDAGATLVHPHMQIVGAPEVPLLAATKAIRCAEYHGEHGRCLVCDLAAAEIRAEERLIGSNDDWTGFAPWASRFPWEMLFVPRRHRASLNQATDQELTALAQVLVPALGALFAVHSDPSLNIVIHSATVGLGGEAEHVDSSHWHLEVLPRLTCPAGFEVGTGYAVNSVMPAAAALRLRQEQG